MEERFEVLDKDGNYLNYTETRDKCHETGLWHKAVVVFVISTDNQRVLLQQRSANKKAWPNLWDITAGGHVLVGEYGYEAAIRETKEEINLDIRREDLIFIGATTSENILKEGINHHFNEFYVAYSDVDPSTLTLQEEEVQDIRWYTKEEFLTMYINKDERLTDKEGCWNHLAKYFEMRG